MRPGIASLLICTLLMAGCATTPATKSGSPAKPGSVKEWLALQSRAKRNAIIGGIIGALAGAALGGGNRQEIVSAALGGALIGAIAGYAVGNQQDRVFAGRDLAIRETDYAASQGYIARVDEVSFHPPQPKPGL